MITDCPQSVNSIPLEAPRHGYELLAQRQEGPTLRFYIRVPESE